LAALFAGILALAIHTGSMTDNFPQLYATPLGATVMMSIAAYSSLMLLVLLVRVFMVMSYKSAPSLPDGDLPSVTVIIPAYNEGADCGAVD